MIVIRNGEHRDPERLRLVDQCLRVPYIVVGRRRSAAVRPRVVTRIDLQRAPAELGTCWLTQCDRD